MKVANLYIKISGTRVTFVSGQEVEILNKQMHIEYLRTSSLHPIFASRFELKEPSSMAWLSKLLPLEKMGSMRREFYIPWNEKGAGQGAIHRMISIEKNRMMNDDFFLQMRDISEDGAHFPIRILLGKNNILGGVPIMKDCLSLRLEDVLIRKSAIYGKSGGEDVLFSSIMIVGMLYGTSGKILSPGITVTADY